jgi:CRP-like cAMP-binding protein
LHWSLCQFTGGMDEVSPQRTVERFYAVLIWLVTFVATVVIFSNLTANMTQQYMINGTQSRQLATLRKYLNQNFISSNLSLRMHRSAQHAISGDLTSDAIELLPVVAEPLRVEMHFEMYSTVMRVHPFFAEYIWQGPQEMRRVCHYGTGQCLLSNGDNVFSKGEAPSSPKMYFVCKGTLEYTTAPGNGRDDIVAATVTDRMYIAEAVLWMRWTYKGTLTATSDAKLATLDAKTFQEIVDRFKEVGGSDPKVYAADFVAYMNRSANAGAIITDLMQMKA